MTRYGIANFKIARIIRRRVWQARLAGVSGLLTCLVLAAAQAAVVKDQGRIYGTGGTVALTRQVLSQSITAGADGQLAAIQLQVKGELPVPAPRLNLAIVAGDNPPAGETLYAEQLDPTRTVQDGVLTWDVRAANLPLQAGDRFVVTISATSPGIAIQANDPPGYLPGELYRDGKPLPRNEMNDIAFISYLVQPPVKPGEVIPPPGGHPMFEPDDEEEVDDEEPGGEFEPPPDGEHLVIAANDPPGYEGGQLFLNGQPMPEYRRNDLAFITYMKPSDGTQADAQQDDDVAVTEDQGRIFGTDGTINITRDTLAQSVTVGMAGQLTAITMQWNAELPDPLPNMILGILEGGDPGTWKTLHMEQVNPAEELPVDDSGVFTWDLTPANLHFEQGDQFTFTLSAESGLNEARVLSTRDIGTVANDPGVFTRDCGYSTQFRGRSIWFFGDTILRSPNADDQRLLCNSWSITHDTDAGDGVSGFQPPVDRVGAAMSLIPLRDEETVFNLRHQGKSCLDQPCGARWAIWPGTIAIDNDSDVAYLFYHKVLVEPGEYRFTHVGHSIAILHDIDRAAERPEFDLYEDYPTLLFAEPRDGFGSAAVKVDDVLYVYGCELQPDNIMKPCSLARVPVADILDRQAWEFYRGRDEWSPDLEQATTVFHGNDMMSVFYNEHLSRYVAIYSQPLSTWVMIRTAERPEGPWSRATRLFEGRESRRFMGWIYDALAHPELSTDGGQTMFVTYSRKTDVFRTEFRLVAVEVAIAARNPQASTTAEGG